MICTKSGCWIICIMNWNCVFQWPCTWIIVVRCNEINLNCGDLCFSDMRMNDSMLQCYALELCVAMICTGIVCCNDRIANRNVGQWVLQTSAFLLLCTLCSSILMIPWLSHFANYKLKNRNWSEMNPTILNKYLG